jgi:hypothetical protein
MIGKTGWQLDNDGECTETPAFLTASLFHAIVGRENRMTSGIIHFGSNENVSRIKL